MTKKVLNVVQYVFLIIASFISIFPIFWMIIACTNKSVDVTRGTLLPGSYFLENLKTLLASDLQYLTAYKNSLLIAVVTTALAMVVSSVAGYAFVVYKSKSRERVFSVVLLSMMVPFAALMVPLFRLFSKFNSMGPLKVIGLNTPMSVIIIAIATAFLIFFFRQNTQSFPKELIEAARIDGLSEAGIFFKVFMPTNKSCYAAAIVTTFMTSWNNYLWPLIALQSPEKRTLPLVMAAMGSSYTPDYGMMMVAVLIMTIPTALIFFFMQKQFVALLVLGSFMPDESSGIIDSNDILLSNVTSFMAGQLNSILQKLEIPVDIGIDYHNSASTGSNIFDVAISTQLFNNRVIVGGSVANRGYANTMGAQQGDVIGDLDIQIKLDPEGKYRFNMFSHSADEYSSILDMSQRNGVGFSFQKEYYRFSDFLRSIFAPKEAAADSTARAGAPKEMTTIRIENEER